MNIILSDGKILVDENILNKIPHFISAKHFTTEMQEYDLHSYTVEQFTAVLRYLTTGYVELYIKTNIFDYLQVKAQPLKVIMNTTMETIYSGESKYIIKDGYIELDNEVSYKFKVYVAGLDEHYNVELYGLQFILYLNDYKFTYNLERHFKKIFETWGITITGLYSDIYGKEMKIKFQCVDDHYKKMEKTIFLTFSSVIPN